MSSNFQYYRAAAGKLSTNWLRGDFYDGDGNECLVQGVLTSAGIHSQRLPNDMEQEIDAKLMKFWRYRMLRASALSRGHSIQDAIMAWNDTGRQKTVVKALTELADEHEVQWLRDERIRLTFEISRLVSRVDKLEADVTALKVKIANLQTQIDDLKRENGLLRRLTNSATLMSDRRQLRELEAEMSTMWDQLSSERDLLSVKTTELDSLPNE